MQNAKVYYRGARLWRAIMDELLAKGMKNADTVWSQIMGYISVLSRPKIMDRFLNSNIANCNLQALFAGCSAGGLGAILQCDNFRALLPSGAKVKCLSDAGFFINAYVSWKPVNEFFSIYRDLIWISTIICRFWQ